MPVDEDRGVRAWEPATVGELVELLLERFPRCQAEDWDRVGLLAGDPVRPVTKVALALDATAAAVLQAQTLGANVLLTHHPAFLEPPAPVSPMGDGVPAASGCLWEAVHRDVALVAMHTNLDRSVDACLRLPHMLGLAGRPGVERGREDGTGALGSLASMPPLSLDAFARRCRDVFGRVAQVYGTPSQTLERPAFFTGSLGKMGEDALAAGADAVVCGECGYHRALDLVQAGCAVIILGHDASELPLVDVLESTLVRAGFPRELLVRAGGGDAWYSL